MAHHYPTPLPLLELPLEQWLQVGNTRALKKALVDSGLLDDFAEYLIKVFNDKARFTNSAAAAHDFVDLVHEFGGNREQQKAVLALLPHTNE